MADDLIAPATEAVHTKVGFLLAAILALLAIALVVTMGIPGLAIFALIGTVLSFILLIIFAVGG